MKIDTMCLEKGIPEGAGDAGAADPMNKGHFKKGSRLWENLQRIPKSYWNMWVVRKISVPYHTA